jgi:hypothetical protein
VLLKQTRPIFLQSGFSIQPNPNSPEIISFKSISQGILKDDSACSDTEQFMLRSQQMILLISHSKYILF